MIKPDSLRAAIAAVFPDAGKNPESLRLWIDKGAVVARQGLSRAFEYRYTLNAVLVDFTGHPSLVMLVIIQWLETNQPDLLAGGRADSFTFEADIIDKDTVDLSIELPLSEAVRVTPRAGGGFDLVHVAEEVPLFPDMEPMSDPAAPLSEIWWRDERLIPGPPLP